MLYLTLSNVGMMMRPDLFDPHTIHGHGFAEAAATFDGVPGTSLSINMGSSFTYFYNLFEPGTLAYHCHVEATEHMEMGMLAQFFVKPKQDLGDPINGFNKFVFNDLDGATGYDVAYPLQLHSFDPEFHDASLAVQPLPFALMNDRYPMINGRGYPDTTNPADLVNQEGFAAQNENAVITATQGQRILLRLSSMVTTETHTLTIPGIPMTVVGLGSRILRTDGLPSGAREFIYTTNSVNVSGGMGVDVILDTRGADGVQGTADDVEPGTYFLYTTKLNHLSNHNEDYGGMMTEIVIQ
jgi:FtsP/CotA-like multicopper oxidase with cupredoxin domain